MKTIKNFKQFEAKYSKESDIIDKINTKALKFGFKKTKLTKDDKDEKGIKYIAKWKKSKDEYIILFSQEENDYEVSFVSGNASGNDPAENWTKNKIWKEIFGEFEDVYYPPDPIYETDEERDERIQKFVEEFMDEQVGLEILNINCFDRRIGVWYKKSEREIIENGRKYRVSEKDKELHEKRAKDEWRQCAEELIEKLDREFGYSGFELSMLTTYGFEIRNYGELQKQVTGYSRYPFGG